MVTTVGNYLVVDMVVDLVFAWVNNGLDGAIVVIDTSVAVITS